MNTLFESIIHFFMKKIQKKVQLNAPFLCKTLNVTRVTYIFRYLILLALL